MKVLHLVCLMFIIFISQKCQGRDLNSFDGVLSKEWLLELGYDPETTTQLNLANMGIKSVEESTLDEYTQLESTDLSNNEIVRLDPELFNNCLKLETIDLRHNRLELIDSSLFEGLSELKVLSLSHNRLFYLDEGSLPSLNS